MKFSRNVTLMFILLFVSIGAYSQLWKQYADSGTTFSVQKNTEKAIEFYYKAKEELKKDSLGTNSYARICNNLAHLYYYLKQWEKVEPLLLEAKQIQEKVLGKEHQEYAGSCNNLALLYQDMRQYEKAAALFLEAKQIQEKLLGKEDPDYANACNNLADLYVVMRQFEKAKQLYLEAKQIREKLSGKQDPDYANACTNLAGVYADMRQFEKAEQLYLEVKQIQGRENPDYAGSCYNLAILYSDMRKYEKVEPLLLEAMQIWEKLLGKEDRDYLRSCINLAKFYADMGLYEKAGPLYLETKQVQEKMFGKEDPDYALSCNNLASLYQYMGLYEKAEPLHLEAMQIWEKLLGKEDLDYAGSGNNLAGLYADMGLYEKAEQLYMEAKQIREKVLGKEDPEYAASCNNLALLYRKMGQYEKAEPLYLEAKQIREKLLGKEDPDYAGSCNNLATLYLAMGHYEKAEPLYLEAKQIREKVLGKEDRDYAASCNNLAILYYNMGQYEKAEPFNIEAKQIRQKVLGKQHPDYGLSCSTLGKLYWVMHQPLRTEKEFKEKFSVNAYNLNSVFQFTNEKEKASFIKNILGEDDIAYSFYVSAKLKSEQPYALSLFHRNLILSSSQALRKQLFSANDTNIRSKYNEWINLKKSLSILYSKPVKERKENVSNIEEKAGQLEKELTRLSSTFKNQHQKKSITWQAIQQNLKAGETAIEFVEFNFYDSKRWTDSTFYIALVLRKDKAEPELVTLFEKKQLENLLVRTDKNITTLYTKDVGEGDNNAGTRSVYQLIWQPLERHLAGINKVYFAPAGLLHRISFAALPVNSKEVLSDKYHLVQLNTTASVVDQSSYAISVSDKIALYGGISYNADSTALKNAVLNYAVDKDNSRSLPGDLARGNIWQELKGTRVEIDEIKKEAATKYAVSALSGINASEESLKALDGKASPAVLHIATHGFFFPDPKEDKRDNFLKSFETSGKAFRQSDNPLFRSGLLFAGANNAWKEKPVPDIEDGILTAYEVSNMYLPNTKLVVLSACETALGDIQGSEGVYGLQRAFKMAGVQNLVMSLWKVPDTETAEFMQLFYKNLFAKQTISNAFYNAQQVMKKKYKAEPYKWAAWILVR